MHKNNVSVCVDPDLTYNEHEENYRAYFIRALLPVILTINQMHWRGDILPSVCKHYLVVDIYLPYLDILKGLNGMSFGNLSILVLFLVKFQTHRIKTILGHHVTKITANCQPFLVIKSHKKPLRNIQGDLPNSNCFCPKWWWFFL